jgi:hypothetical protein
LAPARARRVAFTCSGVGGSLVFTRGSLLPSLRAPKSVFFSCAFSCSSFASRSASSVTNPSREHSWSTRGTTIDQF